MAICGPDPLLRDAAELEKFLCAPLARRVFATSAAIGAAQFRQDVVIVPNGTTHLPSWSQEWAVRRGSLREELGFDRQFVIVNISKSRDARASHLALRRLVELADEARSGVPDLCEEGTFVLVGHVDATGATLARQHGLRLFSNPNDAAVSDLLAASDLYLDLADGIEFDWGVARARAMGLPVVASDVPAHHQRGVNMGNSLAEILRLTSQAFVAWQAGDQPRAPDAEGWEDTISQLIGLIEDDVLDARSSKWL